MTVDRDVRPDDETRAGPTSPPDPDPDPPAEVSRATVIWYAVVAGILVSWFFWGWLVLRQGFVDSVGELLGSAFALLLTVSIVGMLRRSRR
jgi:hypothetical protein